MRVERQCKFPTIAKASRRPSTAVNLLERVLRGARRGGKRRPWDSDTAIALSVYTGHYVYPPAVQKLVCVCARGVRARTRAHTEDRHVCSSRGRVAYYARRGQKEREKGSVGGRVRERETEGGVKRRSISHRGPTSHRFSTMAWNLLRASRFVAFEFKRNPLFICACMDNWIVGSN